MRYYIAVGVGQKGHVLGGRPCPGRTASCSFSVKMRYYIASELAKRDGHVLGGNQLFSHQLHRQVGYREGQCDCCSRRKEKERRSFHVEDWAPIGSLGGREASQKKVGKK